MRSPKTPRTPVLRSSRRDSPASRDPRFSRVTPDQLLARVVACQHTADVIGHRSMWAAELMHVESRTRPFYCLERKRAILALEKIAEAAEKVAAEKNQDEVGSTPRARPVAHQETMVEYAQPQRSVFGSEEYGLALGSPVTALAALK